IFAFAAHLLPASNALALLAPNCRHVCSHRLWLLPDGPLTFSVALEQLRNLFLGSFTTNLLLGSKSCSRHKQSRGRGLRRRAVHDRGASRTGRVHTQIKTAMLELRPTCENCNALLPPNSTEAMICTFEC